MLSPLARALLGIALLGATASAQPPPAAQSPPASSASIEPALQPFMKAVADYVALRERLYKEVPRLMPNSDARQITAASDALARAVQRARANAKLGDFFDQAASQVLSQRLQEAIKAAQLDIAALNDEPPLVTTPRLHLRFPEAAQMAIVPPSVLRVLPPLPEGLEYRIVGNSLVLRDMPAALILDYIPQAFAVK